MTEPFNLSTQDAVNHSAIDFEMFVRTDVAKAEGNAWIKGGGSSPWDVVASYVIALEKRVKELESK